MKKILIIGGYGNFGRLISQRLALESGLEIIIAGRSEEKARAFALSINAQWAVIDIERNIDAALERIHPDILIHTSGPFQGQGYDVAEACIRHKCHYIDLADGRDFVSHITGLNDRAQQAGVLVVSGASSVPCLTASIIDHYRHDFKTLERVDYAIATAQHTNAGQATTAAILGYAGKGFTTKIDGHLKTIYGWQDITIRKYPEIGFRLLANCDIPDLTLFPDRYPDLQTIRFHAGLEVPLLHLGLWGLSWLVRLKLLKGLKHLAALFSKIAPWFDAFGTDRSAFHMELTGIGKDSKPLKRIFYILTASGHGPYIPCIPSALLAIRLSRGELSRTGAMPCMDLITLEEYLEALKAYDIKSLSVPMH